MQHTQHQARTPGKRTSGGEPGRPMRIEVVQGDITVLAVDAIVNAANETLLGGGGVDGAIHRAAGSGLLAECRDLPEHSPGVRCPTGEARITRGHRLHARYVIHTVGPVWDGGGQDEADRLASCYRSALALAEEKKLKSVAFPAISCGVYGYPSELAVPLAVETVRRWGEEHAYPARVIFCAHDGAMAAAYRRAVDATPQ
jgi:O-acetyl-ADP-ribose deacetylase (regulator of RNase III)